MPITALPGSQSALGAAANKSAYALASEAELGAGSLVQGVVSGSVVRVWRIVDAWIADATGIYCTRNLEWVSGTVAFNSATAGNSVRIVRATDANRGFESSGSVPNFTINVALNERGLSPALGLRIDAPAALPAGNVLAAPVMSAATNITATGGRLNFTDPNSNETGVRVFRRLTSGGANILEGTAAANALIFDVTGQSSSTTGFYVVQAFNAQAESGFSNEISFTTLAGAGGGALTAQDAARLLNQATFGATRAGVTQATTLGLNDWLLAEFAKPVSQMRGLNFDGPDTTLPPTVDGPFGWPAHRDSLPLGIQRDNYDTYFRDIRACLNDFYSLAISGPDQLRLKTSWGLMQWLATTARPAIEGERYAIANHVQLFFNTCFTNYREVLRQFVLSPITGTYVDGLNNDPVNPNENVGREFLQLYTVGSYLLNLDGTYQSGAPLPTYTQGQLRNYAFALTGWTYPAGGVNKYAVTGLPVADAQGRRVEYYKGLMAENTLFADNQERALLSGFTAAAGATPSARLNSVLDSVMAHPNIGPFVAKSLIQVLVLSNPSPAYVARVATAFNNGTYTNAGVTFGGGVKGDMKALIAAILCDTEARGSAAAKGNTYGKLREPVQHFTNCIRVFGGTTYSDGYWLDNYAAPMGQRALIPPSVFNFYPPLNPVPEAGGINGPEFKIASMNSILTRQNFVNYLLFNLPGSTNGEPPLITGAQADGITGAKLDFSGWLGFTNAQVVEELCELLAPEEFSAGDKTTIVNMIATIPGGTDADKIQRIKNAAFLVKTSPQCEVQK
jgi:hypothetical protein